MICTKLQGRLGNTLFQIASSYALCERFNREFYLTNDWEYNQYMKNPLPIIKGNRFVNTFTEVDFKFNEISESYDSIFGYFQTEKYFADYRNDILDLFDPSDSAKQQVLEEEFKLGAGTFCSIHVRRGDYLTFPDFHPVLGMDYYTSAMGLIHEIDPTTKFLVFSDDIEYCKTMFGDKVLYIENADPFINLLLMSRCNHNIIANSSLSWWGAWLRTSAGTTVAPAAWFGPRYEHLNTEDLLPKNWEKL